MSLCENLKTLSLLNGSSGDEGAVRKKILSLLSEIPDCTAYSDNVGNVIAEKHGKSRPKNRLLFCARMDEVGFIITDIDDSGFLKFECIGGIDPRVVIGRRALLGENAVPALIGSKALHLLEGDERTSPADISKLYMDIGADSKEDALRLVPPGSRGVFEGDFVTFGDGFAMGKALEGRGGCAALLKLLSAPAEYDFCACFAVRKECGGAGSGSAAFALAPDMAVIVDGALAGDTPAVSGEKHSCSLGKGVVTAFKDMRTIYDTELCRLVIDLGEKHGIPVQIKTSLSEKSLGEDVHKSRGGVRTVCAEYPVRYAKSAGSVLKLSDLEHEVSMLKILSTELCAL